jgi:hypothetical protein
VAQGPVPNADRPPPPWVEPPKPLLPVLVGEVERLLQAGRYAEAVLLAYPRAEDDIRRAYSLSLPKQWTHREFLAWFLRPDMGYITTLLPRLYALYEPVRYGPTNAAPPGDLLPLVRAIYQEAPLRGLRDPGALLPPAASAPWANSVPPVGRPPRRAGIPPHLE